MTMTAWRCLIETLHIDFTGNFVVDGNLGFTQLNDNGGMTLFHNNFRTRSHVTPREASRWKRL